MAPARKVFTEAMIRKVMQHHFEVESNSIYPGPLVACECGWERQSGPAAKMFEDHFIDQLHKLWHEMFSRNPKSDAEESLDAVEKRQLEMGLRR